MALMRMDFSVLSLLLLLQLPTIFASGVVLESKVCDDLIVYSNYGRHELFYVNGNSVGKAFFCEALKAFHEKGCNFEGYLKSDHCHLDLSTGTALCFTLDSLV